MATSPLNCRRDAALISHVDAWDPVTGKRAWSMPYKYVLLASMLATAGDLVFTGNPEGEFFALDAKSGNKLVELSNRRGPSRLGSLVFSQWPAIHRYADWMALVSGRSLGAITVPRSGLATGLDAGGVRVAGGVAMKTDWWIADASRWERLARRRTWRAS